MTGGASRSTALPTDPAALADRIRDGSVRAAARAMRWADDRDPRADEVLKSLYPSTGHARVVGVTGNPGSGKSTLVDGLIGHWRGQGKTVGVVAIDPSSPFTGGAILGDRVRMRRHFLDPGVFIRSLATRGHLGGLSASTLDTVGILDALGLDLIIVETVGVGQDEVDVVRAAHRTVVVLVPGLGDEIQALKAGLLEIADVYCINKADRDGVERLEQELRLMQELDHSGGKPRRPVVRTVAVREEGIAELAEAIDEGGEEDEEKRAADQAELRLRTLIEDRLVSRVLAKVRADGLYDEAVEQIATRARDPYAAAEALIEAGLREDDGSKVEGS